MRMNPNTTLPRTLARKLAGERGQAAIETAIILPLIVALALGGLQSLWMVQCGDALTSAIEHVRVTVRPGDECTGDAAASRVRAKLIEAQPLLATGELTISDAKISQDAPSTSTVNLPDSDFDAYQIATKNVTATRMRLHATITYRPPALFWLMQPTYGRNVDSSVLVEERFEIG